jgi:Mg-chelatase subunit ChlD
MIRPSLLALILAAGLPALSAESAKLAAPRRATAARAPQIEVLFVLDTTGSMGGLLEGAKLKIWSIASQMLQARPTPRLRIGLLGYRDRGDAYVTRFTDLTEDVDAVYAQLTQFQAGGGGDAPESVNQALHEAITRASWSQDRKTLKLVFLVGDAPPHMDYQDDVKYPASCALAAQRDLVINTIQCGSMAGTARVWEDIARRAGGSYAAIGQTGNMQAIATPYDAELAKLNAEVGATLVPYGREDERKAVAAKQARAESVAASAPSAVADRLAFNAATGRVVQGGGDLLDDLKGGRVSLEKVAPKDLPLEMQAMDTEQRRAYVKRKEADRAKVQARIADLTKQRQAWLEQDAKQRAASGSGDSFDQKVGEAIRAQAARKGLRYGK